MQALIYFLLVRARPAVRVLREVAVGAKHLEPFSTTRKQRMMYPMIKPGRGK